MKLDILAIGVHPDDVELSCAGTILKEIAAGKKVGILDLTQGELGTRGSATLRLKEAAKSAKILGLTSRDNLGMKDGFFSNDEQHQIAIIEILRKYQPEIILANAIEDRHPDHGRAAKLIADACFYSGLRRIESTLDGKKQSAWRPKAIYHYIQDYFIKPDLVVDISPYVATKFKAIKAFSSQFYDPESKEPKSPISVENFDDYLNGRMVQMGRYIGADFGEGFTVSRPIGVNSIMDLS
ncbi:MAG: bacillithiol biosynthesis deacetylase BshB1 [Bacteroidetes bacterium]|nr:MAG: bacillithiol biosynthesis deacetylase BshB1 [Bacteroidota bacterium]MBL1144337.1 bacillithiol biosynthesis deacetylase BshB1 [Bacteroidota bacterium]NOG57133.1 bacillithiol biosynthesis deacetylase BshB1 [Bacteroidota bacterium]